MEKTHGWCDPGQRRGGQIGEPRSLAAGIRIDHTVNKRLNLFGRFNESPSDVINGIENRTHNFSNTRMLTLGATWVLSTRMTSILERLKMMTSVVDRYCFWLKGEIPPDPERAKRWNRLRKMQEAVITEQAAKGVKMAPLPPLVPAPSWVKPLPNFDATAPKTKASGEN